MAEVLAHPSVVRQSWKVPVTFTFRPCGAQFVTERLHIFRTDLDEITSVKPRGTTAACTFLAVVFERGTGTHTVVPTGILPTVAAPFTGLYLCLLSNSRDCARLPLKVDVHVTSYVIWRNDDLRCDLATRNHALPNCVITAGELRFLNNTLPLAHIRTDELNYQTIFKFPLMDVSTLKECGPSHE